MQLGRCPTCHSRISLEAVVQDESGRELMALLAKTNSGYAKILVSYLGLFRSPSRDLSNDRALKLTKEISAISENKSHIKMALYETVQSMHLKQDKRQFKPLKNHNYLKAILKNITEQPGQHQVAVPVKREAVIKENTHPELSKEQASAHLKNLQSMMIKQAKK